MAAIASSMFREGARTMGLAFCQAAAGVRRTAALDLPRVRAGVDGCFVLTDASRPGALTRASGAGCRSAERRSEEMTRTPRQTNKPAACSAGPDDINW